MAMVLVSPSAHAADPCLGLTPAADPDTNRVSIQQCLDGPDGQAVLTTGMYPVDGGITIRSNARLLGDSTYPTIRLVTNPAQASTLVTFIGTGGRAGFVNLDASCCTSVVAFAGDSSNNNLLDDGAVTGAPTATGVYVICRNCQGNGILRDNIYGNNLGVIFVRFNTAAYPNTVDSSDVHDNACDGVTFAGGRGTPDHGGYGIVQHSRLHDNGGQCANGIPAAGAYSQDNDAGATLTDNDIYNNCGSDVDLVDSQNFTITGNRISNPGHLPSAATLNCQGLSADLLGISNSTIRDNDIRSTGNPHNAAGVWGDPNNFFTYAGVKYHDLPGGASGVVAFLLAARLSAGHISTHNVIDHNTIIASCSTPCVATGYFATRDTGYDITGAWSPATTNYYTRNNPFGSNVGSRRGGGNWYAGNDTCPANPSPTTQCNQDDYQHPTNVDWARNDAFYRY
jgi:hypothetical protein